MDWATAIPLTAGIIGLTVGYWVRRAYDKSPTLHIIRNEQEQEPEQADGEWTFTVTIRDDFLGWND